MSTSKIRIKLGAIEVEYEGNEEFLKKELPDLIAAVSKLHSDSGGRFDEADSPAPKTKSKTQSGSFEGTTATIAAKLGSESGGELIVAAAAQLTLVEGMDDFSTKDLRAACRKGKNLWKKSYANNFAIYLANLVKAGALNEVREDVYALDAKKKKEVETALAKD